MSGEALLLVETDTRADRCRDLRPPVRKLRTWRRADFAREAYISCRYLSRFFYMLFRAFIASRVSSVCICDSVFAFPNLLLLQRLSIALLRSMVLIETAHGTGNLQAVEDLHSTHKAMRSLCVLVCVDEMRLDECASDRPTVRRRSKVNVYRDVQPCATLAQHDTYSPGRGRMLAHSHGAVCSISSSQS